MQVLTANEIEIVCICIRKPSIFKTVITKQTTNSSGIYTVFKVFLIIFEIFLLVAVVDSYFS